MKYSPKMHEELIRGHKAADVHPWQDEDTLQGLLEIVYQHRAVPEVDQRHGRVHAPARRRLARRLHQRLRHAPLLRGARRARPAERDDHDDLLAPVRRGDALVAGFKVITVMPDEDGYPDLEAFRAAVSEKTVGCMITNPEDTGIYNPQIDKYVEILHDAGALASPTRPTPTASWASRGRATPASTPATSICTRRSAARTAARARRAAPTWSARSWRRTCRCRSLTRSARGTTSTRPPGSRRQPAWLPRQLVAVIRAYAWVPQPRGPGPPGGRGGSIINNNYLDNLLDGRRTQPPVRGGPSAARPGPLQLGALKEYTGVGTAAHPHAPWSTSAYRALDEPSPVGGPEPFTPEPCETYSKDDLDEWAAVDQEGQRRGVRRCTVRARFAARPAHRPDAAPRGHGGPRTSGLSRGASTSARSRTRSDGLSERT